MRLAHLLASALAIQVQASSVSPAGPYIQRTERALLTELARIPATLAPPVVEPPAPQPVRTCRPEPRDAAMLASRCRALMLEVVRRAAHDWVLYRNTRKMQDKALAEDAYLWLFEEKPGHPRWELRQRRGNPLMAFLTICENLDLDPEAVRRRAKALTIRDIMTAGRPAETRKVRHEGVEDYETPEGLGSLSDTDVETTSQYEQQFAVHTY